MMKKRYMSMLLTVCLAVMSLTAVIRAEEQVEAVDVDAAIVAEEGTVGTEFTEPAERITAADAEIVEDETLAGFEVIEPAESAADEEMPDTLAVEVPGQGEMADEVAGEEPAMDFVETGAEPGFEEDFSVEGTDEGAIEEAVESALEEDATPEETVESESSEEESFAQAEPVMDVVEALPEETDSAENEEEFAGELVFEDIEDRHNIITSIKRRKPHEKDHPACKKSCFTAHLSGSSDSGHVDETGGSSVTLFKEQEGTYFIRKSPEHSHLNALHRREMNGAKYFSLYFLQEDVNEKVLKIF